MKREREADRLCPTWAIMFIGAWPAAEACLACSEIATARVWTALVLLSSLLAQLW